MAYCHYTFRCVSVEFKYPRAQDLTVDQSTFPFYRSEDIDEERSSISSKYIFDAKLPLKGGCCMWPAHEPSAYFISSIRRKDE